MGKPRVPVLKERDKTLGAGCGHAVLQSCLPLPSELPGHGLIHGKPDRAAAGMRFERVPVKLERVKGIQRRDVFPGAGVFPCLARGKAGDGSGRVLLCSHATACPSFRPVMVERREVLKPLHLIGRVVHGLMDGRFFRQDFPAARLHALCLLPCQAVPQRVHELIGIDEVCPASGIPPFDPASCTLPAVPFPAVFSPAVPVPAASFPVISFPAVTFPVVVFPAVAFPAVAFPVVFHMPLSFLLQCIHGLSCLLDGKPAACRIPFCLFRHGFFPCVRCFFPCRRKGRTGTGCPAPFPRPSHTCTLQCPGRPRPGRASRSFGTSA